MLKNYFLILCVSGMLGCANPPLPANQQSVKASTITFGLIQQVVSKGATKDQIVSTLGSPNMITNNSNNEETWIYDKVTTEYQNESGSSSGSILGGAVIGSLGGAGTASTSTTMNRGSTTQRTLTLIVKFKNDIVDSYATRATAF